jgi:DMSO reductase family type II enzyme molybdopterin subunit
MAHTADSWEQRYRDKWKWDKVTWGTHAVDCYPGGCPFRVFSRDGRIVREEQAAIHSPIEEGIPDMNPMGCQKGACWSHCHYSPDRVTVPLRRVGERGEGKFEEVSWDEALDDIADKILDAIGEQGPESIIIPLTPELGAVHGRFWSQMLGVSMTDGDAEFQDFSPGYHLTWGLYNPVASMDDWFLADLTLIWHANPVYTNIHWYHYLAESRYNGGEVVTIAPDYSPSAIHADYHLPVRIGTDAALALAMCKVIIDAELYQKRFVQEQTDLPLLVRKDTGRFLRGDEVYEGEREDQFFWWNPRSGTLVSAPRHTLATAGVDPALEGSYEVLLKDLSTVEVEPVFARLRRHLEDYTPEKAGEICQLHPDNIRKLARKVATRKTKIFIGWNSGKYYHGDLMERAMALLLGLTGNWGKKGTGTRSWAVFGVDGEMMMPLKGASGQEAAQRHIQGMLTIRRMVGATDPTQTAEMLQNRMMELVADLGGEMGVPVPPAFLWYYQEGYKERWNDPENNCPTMKRTYDEYVTEAVEKGWWGARYSKAYQTIEPRVLFEAGGNYLRRNRGGQKHLLEHFWPKLELVVSVDYRITTTGLYSDYILPAAQHYEKIGHSMLSVHHLNWVLTDHATEPPGKALPDLHITIRLLGAIERRAAARGITEFRDYNGTVRSLTGLVSRFTHDGAVDDEEKYWDEALKDSAAYGILPEDASLEMLREKGQVRYTNWGLVGHGQSQASTLEPDQVHNPLRWHTEDKIPYDTLVRRAQYYIDHEWFLEAGEELPTHKEPPNHGGAGRRFLLTSGHNRWSIHSMNMTNNIIQNTHRGEPFVFINDGDAAELGIANGEQVRLVNNAGDTLVAAKISPSVRPGQVILYNGFEPYQHENWYSQADIEPGHVKHLGFASGYGHLRYRLFSWQPIPADRAIRIDVEKVG